MIDLREPFHFAGQKAHSTCTVVLRIPNYKLTKWTLIIVLILVVFHGSMTLGNQTMEEKGHKFEGDISMSVNDMKTMEKEMDFFGTVHKSVTWPGGIVPYKISPTFSPKDRDQILQGMEAIMDASCVRFVPFEGEKDWLNIRVGSGCSSGVGRRGKGKQEIILNPRTCLRHGTVVHELLHTLGFWHEQSRLDRDKYVDIEWKNIGSKKAHNFAKYTSGMSHDFGLPYDYGSVLHYSAEAFQKKPGVKTILPKAKGAPVGLRITMSHFDKLKINRMYGCDLKDKAKEALNPTISRS